MAKHRPDQTSFALSCPWCGTKIRDDYELETHWQTCEADPLRKTYDAAWREADELRAEVAKLKQENQELAGMVRELEMIGEDAA